MNNHCRSTVLNVYETPLQISDDFAYKGVDDAVYLIYAKISKDSVLVGLNVTNQVAAHYEILLRSKLRQSAAVVGLSTMIKRLVSSANRRIWEPMSVTISLMYNKNSRGPKMEPCGTPARMKAQSDEVLSIRKIILEPGKGFSCDPSCMKFMYETKVPNTVKCFADVAEDSPNLFT